MVVLLILMILAALIAPGWGVSDDPCETGSAKPRLFIAPRWACGKEDGGPSNIRPSPRSKGFVYHARFHTGVAADE
jgi:hypothetical protein